MVVTLTTINARDVEAAVREVAHQHLPGERIVSVAAKPGFDHDGDPIWRIMIVVDDRRAGRLETRGFIGYLRERLATLGETAFPIPSFVSESEAARLKPEAA